MDLSLLQCEFQLITWEDWRTGDFLDKNNRIVSLANVKTSCRIADKIVGMRTGLGVGKHSIFRRTERDIPAAIDDSRIQEAAKGCRGIKWFLLQKVVNRAGTFLAKIQVV